MIPNNRIFWFTYLCVLILLVGCQSTPRSLIGIKCSYHEEKNNKKLTVTVFNQTQRTYLLIEHSYGLSYYVRFKSDIPYLFSCSRDCDYFPWTGRFIVLKGQENQSIFNTDRPYGYQFDIKLPQEVKKVTKVECKLAVFEIPMNKEIITHRDIQMFAVKNKLRISTSEIESE